jgi:aminopeptidase YwaD
MFSKCTEYLNYFCTEIPERPVGSAGNRAATLKFRELVETFGWQVNAVPFSALDWEEQGADLLSGRETFQVYPSPYSTGCDVRGNLVSAGTFQELEKVDCSGEILLLHADLTREQLMPKNFVFYNPEEHQRVVAELEKKQPAAILSATSRNASLAGGTYPFPLIEDGDFHIPSVYLTEEEGQRLLQHQGKVVHLISRARRIPAKAYHLTASRGSDSGKRICISAHIDAKKGSPGAIDNGTGVVILLLLAELLSDYSGEETLELLPFNGEDYYAASGQMIFLEQNQGRWGEIQLNINIDGAGYYRGISALSSFNLPPSLQDAIDHLIQNHTDISAGIPWVQGDHSIFLQQGIPAIVFSSQWFLDNLDSQEITHTPKDHPGIVDCRRVIEIAQAIAELIVGVTC